jgi:hypothetical protein
VLTNLRALFEVSKDAYRVTHAPAVVLLSSAATTTAITDDNRSILATTSVVSTTVSSLTPPRPTSSAAATTTTSPTTSLSASSVLSPLSVASSPTSRVAKEQQQLLRRWSLLELTHTDADRMGDHQRHSIKHAVPLPSPEVSTLYSYSISSIIFSSYSHGDLLNIVISSGASSC